MTYNVHQTLYHIIFRFTDVMEIKKKCNQRRVIFLIATTSRNFHFLSHYPVEISPTLGGQLVFRCYIKSWRL